MQPKLSTLMLALASICLARTANCQAPDPAMPKPRAALGSGLPPASNSSQRELLVAEIVFVGNIENAARMANELGELLNARGFAPRFQQRIALSESELVTQQQPNDPSLGTVWILVPNSSLARLVFSDRAHMRFLIRDIPLLQGMDDVGRESVEQVIESSFLALLQGAAAIGPAEVHAALGADVVSAPSPSPTAVQSTPQANAPPAAQPGPWVPAPPPASAPPDTAEAAGTSRQLTQRLGIGYSTSWSGTDFGVEHGPEVLAGLELIRQRDSFYIAGTFDWHFAQHHRTSEFDLSLQNSRVGLVFGWRKPITAPLSFVASVGPGVSATRVRSIAYSNASAASYPDSSSVLPWVRLQGGVEWGSSPLVIQLVLRADMSAYDTHFEINRNGVTETLAHPWFIRPGLALGVVWR